MRRYLGRFSITKTRDSLQEGGKILLDDFDASVKELERLKFQSCDGTWRPANELLTPMGSEDEARRCFFLRQHLMFLADNYDDVRSCFFLSYAGGVWVQMQKC
jgi:hypothetical protein